MLEIIAIFLLLIYGMPFLGVYLLVDKKQEANRGLGLAVMIVGIIVWCMFGITGDNWGTCWEVYHPTKGLS